MTVAKWYHTGSPAKTTQRGVFFLRRHICAYLRNGLSSKGRP